MRLHQSTGDHQMSTYTKTKPDTIQSEIVTKTAHVSTIMSVIERAATSSDIDITKLEKMLEMQERVLDRNAKQSFTTSLAEMQTGLPRIAENGKGHNNLKYALLEDINDTLRPILHRHGFAVTFRIKAEGSMIMVTTVLSHRDGHSEETTIPLAPDTTGSKSAVQAVGSTISYGKRYGICAMLNISTGDDNDGSAGIDISDALQAIASCSTLDELQSCFGGWWKTYPQKDLRANLTVAKDAKKKELSNG